MGSGPNELWEGFKAKCLQNNRFDGAMEHSRSASIGIPTRVGFVSSPFYIRNLCAVSKVLQASIDHSHTIRRVNLILFHRPLSCLPSWSLKPLSRSPWSFFCDSNFWNRRFTSAFFCTMEIRWGGVRRHSDFKILSRTGPLLPHCHSVCPPTNNLRPRHSPLIQHRKKGQWRTPSCKLCTTVFANTARRLVWVYHLSIVGR